MNILRPDLLSFARASERLLATDLEAELSHDEKNFVLYYANELLHKFAATVNRHADHPQLSLPEVTVLTMQTEQSA